LHDDHDLWSDSFYVKSYLPLKICEKISENTIKFAPNKNWQIAYILSVVPEFMQIIQNPTKYNQNGVLYMYEGTKPQKA